MVFDGRSLEDEPNARLLVVEDSDCEEENWNIPNRLALRAVAKQDPYPLQEQLYLALEEVSLDFFSHSFISCFFFSYLTRAHSINVTLLCL